LAIIRGIERRRRLRRLFAVCSLFVRLHPPPIPPFGGISSKWNGISRLRGVLDGKVVIADWLRVKSSKHLG
jgi:hypothetical protein